ncbi:MAG TPA: site-specific integrase [Clostridia bacterium]|nr:site-specific integrase [Clostridia bacterium]
MSLFKYRKKGNYHYDFQFKGKTYRGTLGTSKLTVARDRLRAIRNRIEDAYYGTNRGGIDKTFEEAAKEYQASRKHAVSDSMMDIEFYSLQHLLPVFGKMMLSQITDKDLKAYQQARLAERAAPATINLEYDAFRGIMKMFKWWDGIRDNVRKLPVGDFHGIALSPDEAWWLVRVCAKSVARYLAVVVVLALSTTMRDEEIRLLRWWQVNLVGCYLEVRKSKTKHGSGRVIPLNPFAMRAMTWWANQFPDRHQDDYVFPHERSSMGRDGKARRKTIPTRALGSWKKCWQTAKKRAGVKCRFHDLRHTAITWMLEAGIPYAIVAGIAGWSASQAIHMAKRYGHIGQRPYLDAVWAIQDRFGVLATPPLLAPADCPLDDAEFEVEESPHSEAWTDLDECADLIDASRGELCA